MSLFGDPDPGSEVEGQSEGDPAGQQTEEVQPNYSPYAQRFLSELPEEHRGIVAPHLQKWDAGFTRYSQGVQSELKRYKDLGDAEELKSARQFYDQLRNDPAYVARVLVEQGYYTPETPSTPPAQQVPGQLGQQQEPDDPRLTKIQQENQRMQRALGAVAEYIQTDRQRREQEAADRQLDEYLTSFKKMPGNAGVPDEFILGYLNAGITDQMEIASRWQNITKSVAKPPPPRVPNVMGSGSQPPVAQNVAEYDEKQRKDALRAALFGGQT